MVGVIPGSPAERLAMALFAATTEAALGVAPDGVLTSWNAAAARLFALPDTPAPDQPLPWAALSDRLVSPLPALAAWPPPGTPDYVQETELARPELPATPLAARVVALSAGPAGDSGWLVLLSDISERVAAREQVAESERIAQTVMEEVPVAFALVSLRDGAPRPIYQNTYGEQITGWSNEEWEADPNFTASILHPDDRDWMQAQMAEFQTTLAPYSNEYRLRRPDGAYVWVRDQGNVVHDSDGNPDYLVAIMADMTTLRETEQALRRSVAELETAHAKVTRVSEDKSHYLSMMGHEFRTPLTSIMGFSELIASGDLPDELVVEFATVIGKSSHRLNRMISDMLNLDRLEAGRTAIRRQPVVLGPVVADVLATLQPLSDHHTLLDEVSPALPPVDADPDLLTQVLVNLVTNAIKYAPAGGPITVGASQVDGALEISVHDTGPGIPLAAQELIFSRFSRLGQPHEERIEGSGLGLPITREIVEQHGGKIRVTSSPGTGATFTFTLPIAA